MSISSFLKGLFGAIGSSSSQDPKASFKKTTKTFTFDAIPASVEELKALPEADLDSPFKTAALTVLALNVYAENADLGAAMLDFLNGPNTFSPREKQFLRDRFMDGKTYVPRSFFAGSSPDNDYTPKKPYTVTVSDNPYSYDSVGYAIMWLTSTGADSPRQVKLRKKESTGEWFLWEQMLLSDIRQPKSSDPWA